MKHLLPKKPINTWPSTRMPCSSMCAWRSNTSMWATRPASVHVPWYEYPQMQVDAAQFARQVTREAGGDLSKPVVLLCRSGRRTIPAGEALEAAGFTEVVNVVHGFEGELDENFRRGGLNGWRHDGLPWEQM